MADQFELLQEAAKRGILPAEKRPLYDEAVKRGLIKGEAPEPGDSIGNTLGDIVKWADQPHPDVIPAKRNGDTVEWATPNWIAGPIGAIAGGMRDVGSLIKGKEVPTEELQKSAQGVAGLAAGLGKPVIESAAKGAGKVLETGTKAAKTLGEGLQDMAASDLESYPPPAKTIEDKAREKVMKRIGQDVKGGGMSAQDALDKISDANKRGKPLTLADVGDPNVKGLAGHVARRPGQSQTIAKNFMTERDTAAGQRLTQDVDKALKTGSVKKTAEMLAKTRSEDAKPLFEKAYQGGSMAPLEHQFGAELDAANAAEREASKALAQAHTELTMARGKQAKAPSIFSHNDPRNPATAEIRQAEAAVKAAESKLNSVRGDADEVQARLRQAQADSSANAPGAVWNPRIQRLLDLPIVKGGLNQGLKLERQNAAAEGRPFNATEYAIKGFDEQGNPIVGKVPNMRLLAAAKEGLDAILDAPNMRDPMTGNLTKEGVSVDKVRRALLGELDAANPDYKIARASWAGNSSSIRALQFGRNLFGKDNTPEAIAERITDMTPAEKEFAKLGVADLLREKILKTGIGGDEAKHIVNSEWSREQLRPLFDNDQAFKKFIDSVTDERTMFETRQKLVGGSQTAERVGEDAVSMGLDAAHAVGKAAGGNTLGALKSMWALRRDLDLRLNPQLNEAIARLLFDPEISPEKLGLPPKPAPSVPKTQAGEIAKSIQ